MKTIRIIIPQVLLISVLLLFGCRTSPDTYVYLGKELPKTYVEEIKKLGLLDKGEKIQYFYSDAFLDFTENFYFVSDQKLVIYNEAWDQPETLITFDDIIDLSVVYNDSFFEDSYITVTTYDWIIDFPVSSEKQRDKDFYNYILEQSDLGRNNRKKKGTRYFDEYGNEYIDKGGKQTIIPAEYEKTGQVYKIFIYNRTSSAVGVNQDLKIAPSTFEIINLKDTDTLKLDNGVQLFFGTHGLEARDRESELAGIGGEFLEKYGVPEEAEWAFVVVPAGEGDLPTQ